MRILHTSDWHLGHVIHNYDRTEEQMSMLQQMEQLVEEHKPDVFLLCGDVYHTAQPSSSVQKMFADALVRIHQAHPDMFIIVTAGNHDSGARHEVFQTPWRALHVYAIGALDKEHPEEHIIEIPGKGYVIAVPYCHERNIPEDFFLTLTEMVKQRNEAGLPVILSAHTTVSGCDYSGHEDVTEFSVGGIDGLNREVFGDDYDYLALGHIHNAQFVPQQNHRIRYCGTPLPISFDEKQDHSVSIVDIAARGEEPQVDTYPIVNPRPLVTLPVDGYKPWDEVIKLLDNYPADIPSYIRLNVEVEDFLPFDANAQALALTKGKSCRFCYTNAKRKERERAQVRTMTVAEFQQETPIEIMRKYAAARGEEFGDELQELFTEVVEMIKEDERK